VADSEDEHDLDAHVLSEDCDHYLACCHHGRNFQTNADLMVHRKQEHEKNVKPCWHFSGGGCVLDDKACWFSNIKSNSDNRLGSLKCNYCEQVFDNRYEFMHHGKLEHEQTVPHCKKASSGTCWCGSRKCWFLHEKDTSNQNGNEKN
jgi:hypothetical protein